MKSRLPSLLITLFLGSLCLYAQDRTPTKPEKVPPPLTIRLNVLVRDHKGQPVPNLKAEQIRVFEDDVAQKTTKRDLSTDSPLFLQIGMDTSGSMRSSISITTVAAAALVKNLFAGDEVQLIRFISSDKLENVQTRTADKNEVLQGLESLYIEAGQSAIVDAVYLILDYFEKNPPAKPERRAVVLFSDGEDRDSYYAKKQLFALMQKIDVPIFIFAPRAHADTQNLKLKQADKFIDQLALLSGGTVYRAKTAEEYGVAVTAVLFELYANYQVSYTSTNPKLDGKPRKIRVEVTGQPVGEPYRIDVREGYSPPKK